MRGVCGLSVLGGPKYANTSGCGDGNCCLFKTAPDFSSAHWCRPGPGHVPKAVMTVVCNVIVLVTAQSRFAFVLSCCLHARV